MGNPPKFLHTMKAILAVLLLCLAMPASAITASPMGQTLDPNTTTGSLRILNNSKGAKRYQVLVDVMSVGADGQKVFTPTTEIAFYPATVIPSLGPGKIQTLRWKRPATPGREVIYQVELREEPLDDDDAVVVTQGMSVNLRPRMLLPWAFVPPGATPVLSARHETATELVREVVNGKTVEVPRTFLYLVFENAGSATASIQKISYAGQPDPGPQLVLPGERLRLKVSASAREVKFTQKGVAQTLAVE